MKYVEKVKPIAINEANKLGLIIKKVEWVFENNVNILRIIADKEEGLDIDDSTNLNQAISDALDKDDFIEEEYYLEVSSPGIERELEDDNDVKNNIGEYVHLDLKEMINITKEQKVSEVEGYLEDVNLTEEDINADIVAYVIKINVKGRIKKIEIEKNNTKIIRKAIKF